MTNTQESLSDLEASQPLAVQHSTRFRRVANCYPHRVATAYRDNITAAALDSDEQVAQVVADWERGRGMEPVDWAAVGREERDERP